MNRVKLVQARTRLLLQLRFFRTKIFEQLERDDGPAGILVAEALVGTLHTFTAKDRTYTALAEAFLKDVRQELAERLAARPAAAPEVPDD